MFRGPFTGVTSEYPTWKRLFLGSHGEISKAAVRMPSLGVDVKVIFTPPFIVCIENN
jgi:hypothetical protein